MIQHYSCTPYQELFIAQDRNWSSSSVNVLSGIAVFSNNVDEIKLKESLVRLVNESTWTKLEIDLDLNCWNISDQLNGTFSLHTIENVDLSTNTKLWQISLSINEDVLYPFSRSEL